MMDALDDAQAYHVRLVDEELAERRARRTATCRDCRYVRDPKGDGIKHNPTGIGWCSYDCKDGWFVHLGDRVSETNCDYFEWR